MTRATAIYSDDADIRTLAAAENIPVIGLGELPLPQQNPQIELQLGPAAREEETHGSIDGKVETDAADAAEESDDEAEPEQP